MFSSTKVASFFHQHCKYCIKLHSTTKRVNKVNKSNITSEIESESVAAAFLSMTE